MADVPSEVFVSYADSDLERVRPLVEALSREGWSVWWDRRILPGQSWEEVIGPALDEARCVIVVWSLTSVQSEWVRAEAEDARSRGIVVPVLLDDVRIPLQFRPIQAARLVGWTGDRSDDRFASLRLAITAKLSVTRPSVPQPPREAPKQPARRRAPQQARRPAPQPVQPPAPEPAQPPAPQPAQPRAPQPIRPSKTEGRPEWLSSQRQIDPSAPFLMPIEDIFSITGRGTVVTGRIDRGTIRVGDAIEIVGFSDTSNTSVVTGITMSRKLVDEGRPDDNVGILLRGVSTSDVQRGQVLARPGSIKSHKRFGADVYLLTQQEGGRNAPIRSGYALQFYFRTTDVMGTLELPAGTDMIKPGDNVRLDVGLDTAVAIEKDTVFAIREKDRTIGAGKVLQPSET